MDTCRWLDCNVKYWPRFGWLVAEATAMQDSQSECAAMLCSGLLPHDVPACGACLGSNLLGPDGVFDTCLLRADCFDTRLPNYNRCSPSFWSINRFDSDRFSSDRFGSNRFSANHGGPGLLRGSDC